MCGRCRLPGCFRAPKGVSCAVYATSASGNRTDSLSRSADVGPDGVDMVILEVSDWVAAPTGHSYRVA